MRGDRDPTAQTLPPAAISEIGRKLTGAHHQETCLRSKRGYIIDRLAQLIDAVEPSKAPDKSEDDTLSPKALPDPRIHGARTKTGNVDAVGDHSDFPLRDPPLNEVPLEKLGDHKHSVGPGERPGLQPFREDRKQVVVAAILTVFIRGRCIHLEHDGDSTASGGNQARELVEGMTR